MTFDHDLDPPLPDYDGYEPDGDDPDEYYYDEYDHDQDYYDEMARRLEDGSMMEHEYEHYMPHGPM